MKNRVLLIKRVSGFALLALFLSGFQFANATTFEEGKQAYLSKDYAKALAILKPLAEQGNSQAQITMGLMYDYGHGVTKDPAESLKWYRMAAEQGVPLVQHDLGVKYFQGQGAEQNYLEAAKWWEMSANAGVADSQFNLGLMYYRGIGMEKNYAKAATLFEKAAAQGHGNAQYSLAVMYAFGQDKPKDYAKALSWFHKAAEQGVAQAQFNLGVFHENGYGVAKDSKKAHDWYVLAANQGLQEAIEKLRTLKKPVTETGTVSNEETVSEPVASTVTKTIETSKERNLNDWLRQQAPDNYTLQLGSVVNEKDIIQYIEDSKLDSNIGYIKVEIKGVTRYTAIYGIFETYDEAKNAIDNLPARIRNSKPWVRNTGILQGLLL